MGKIETVIWKRADGSDSFLPQEVAQRFPQLQRAGTDLLSLLTPVRISSAERARAFLYIIYRYLESSTDVNPFTEKGNPENFSLRLLSEEDYQALGENQDEESEIAWGEQMRIHRQEFIANPPPNISTGKPLVGAGIKVENGGADDSLNESEAMAASSKKKVRGKAKAKPQGM